ncbi:Serine-threonine kinase receptor-associated protein [Diplonema papillatum]|nr:Serine-threonine kinase receptor-associated protein [Diplonema papillatum]
MKESGGGDMADAPKRNPISPDAKVKVCSGHTRPVPHIAYSKIVDGTFWFVSSCHDGKPMLRNGETGDWVGTFDGHKGAVFCSCFNDKATHVTTASGDYSVKLWDALNGQDLHSWTHPHCVKFVDWHRSQPKIVSASMDKKIRIFDTEKYDTEPVVWEGHDDQQKMSVHWGDDHNTIYSSAADNVIKKWDLRTGYVTHSLKMENLNSLEYSRANRLLIAASGKMVTLLKPEDLSQRQEYQLTEEAECADLAPDFKHFAVGCKLKAKEYDIITGEEKESHKGHHGPVFHLRYSPDSQTFASGSEDGMVRIWPTTSIIRRNKDDDDKDKKENNDS